MYANEKNVFSLLVLSAITIGTAALATSCNKNNNQTSSTISSSVQLGKATEISCVGGPKSEYSQGDNIDLSDLAIHIKYENGQDIIYYYYSREVTITGVDTSTLGEHTMTIKCEWLEYSFKFTVEKATGVFDFNGGTYDEKSSTELKIVDGQIDVRNVQPTIEKDGQVLKFAGWFTDSDLKNRATYTTDGFIDASTSKHFYAGYDIDYSAIFKYTIDRENGTVTIDSFNWEETYYVSLTELFIPRTIELYPVTKIADRFIYITMNDPDFEDFSLSMASMVSFTSIRFEEGSEVTYIGSDSFNAISTLKKLELPSKLTYIGDNAFASTYISGELVIPATVQKIGENAFRYMNYNLKNVTFEGDSRLKTIGAYAFSNCYSLNEINLPEGLELIGNYAFSNCEDLRYVYIPSTVTEIGLHVFSGDSEIENIEVSSKNENYCSIDGSLYNKDVTTLIRYAVGKTDSKFSLPLSVKRIEESAFSVSNDYSYLKQIDLTEGVEYIGADAFNGISADLYLPASLNSVDIKAFMTYKGSKIEVSTANKTFKSVDGVLYSKDLTELYCIPSGLNVTEFKLNDSVKRIKSNALYKNPYIKFITIGKDSALENVDESGLNIFTMSSLDAIFVEKETPFEIENGAFYTSASFIYNNPIFVFSVSNFNTYKTSWENYDLTHGSDTFRIQGIMYTKSTLLENLIEIMTENGFISYSKYVNLKGNIKDLKLKRDYMTLSEDYNNSLNSLSALYHGGFISEYDEYLKEYEKTMYKYIAKYFENIDKLNKVQVTNLLFTYNRLSEIPASTRSELADQEKVLKAKYDLYGDNLKKTEVLYSNILNEKCTANTFDKATFEKYLQEYADLNIERFSGYGTVEKKFNMLLASYYIDEFLSYDTYNDENKVRVYAIIYGTSNLDVEYNLDGIINILDMGLRSDYRLNNVYRYNEFITKKAEFDAFIEKDKNKTLNKVIDFDFLADFDLDSYVEIINEINLVIDYTRLLSPQLAKILIIYSVYNMNLILSNYQTITNDNLAKVSDLIKTINQQQSNSLYVPGFNETWTLNDLSFYSDYETYLSTYNTYVDNLIETTRNEIDSLDWNNESSTKDYENLKNNYNLLVESGLIDQLDKEYYNEEDGQWYKVLYVYTIQIYDVEKEIKDFLETYDSVTKDNYFAIDDFLNSYYSVEDDQIHTGLLEKIDDLSLYDEDFNNLYRMEDFKEIVNQYYSFSIEE